MAPLDPPPGGSPEQRVGPVGVMVTEIVAATLAWGGIGLVLDWWLGTNQWLLAAGLALGCCCGIYLLWLRGASRPTDDSDQREGTRAG